MSVEIAVLDLTGTIVGVNDAWVDYCTSNDGDLSGCGPGTSYLGTCDTAADPVSTEVAAALREVFSGEQLTAVTFTIPCDGIDDERWYDLRVVPRFDDSTQVIGATVTLWRVARPPAGLATSRRLAISAPEPEGDWDLIEAFPDGTVLVDQHGTITHANRQLEVLSGYDRSSLVGRSIEMLVPERFHSRHEAWTAGYRDAPRVRTMGAGMQLELRRADGREVPVEISLAPVALGSHAMTMASVRDVSAQRAADRSRRRLLHVLDLTPDPVIIVDAASGTVEHVNAGACALLGWSQDELIGMPSVAVAPELVLTGPAGPAAPGSLDLVEVVRRSRDGVDIACDSRNQVVTTSDGSRKLVIVDRDARERRATESARRRHAERSALVARITSMVLSDAPATAVYDAVVAGTTSLLAQLPATTDPAWPIAAEDVLPPEPVGVGTRTRDALDDAVRGLRESGRGPLSADETELLADLGRQVALVMELGVARSARQRLAILEDRQRIARDLHDTVMQALIGVGLQLGHLAGDSSTDETVSLVDSLIEQLDTAIAHLRLVVFDTSEDHGGELLTETLRLALNGAARTLGHQPRLVVVGDPERLSPEVVNHLLLVVREALSNVARRASASRTTVSLTVGDDLVELLVEDDGIGPAAARPGGGTTSFRERSAMLGGTASMLPGDHAGTVLRWTARVGARAD